MFKHQFGSILIFAYNKEITETLITFLLKNYMDKYELIYYLSLQSTISNNFITIHKEQDMEISIYNDVVMIQDKQNKIFIHTTYSDIIRSYAEIFEEMRKVYESCGLNEDSITLKSINFKIGYAMKSEHIIEKMVVNTINAVI